MVFLLSLLNETNFLISIITLKTARVLLALITSTGHLRRQLTGDAGHRPQVTGGSCPCEEQWCLDHLGTCSVWPRALCKGYLMNESKEGRKSGRKGQKDRKKINRLRRAVDRKRHSPMREWKRFDMFARKRVLTSILIF